MKTPRLNLEVKTLGLIFILIMLASLLATSTTTYSSSSFTFEGRETPQFNIKNWRFTLSGPLSNYFLNYTFKPKPLLSPQDLSLALMSALTGGQVSSRSAERNITFTPNVRVTRDVFFYENEPSIASNPLNPDNLVVAAHQYTLTGVFVAVYFSEDGGDSWEGPILLPWARPGDFLASDPGAAATPDGVFYASYLSLGYRTINVGGFPRIVLASDIVVARSEDGGKSWAWTIASTPEGVEFNPPYSISMVLLDKPYIAAGPPKTVVVSYTEFISGYLWDPETGWREFLNITIKAVVSRDGGLTWSKPLKVSPTVDYYADNRVLQGPYPTVAPDGTVYVAYYDSGPDGWLNGSAILAISKLPPESLEFKEPTIIAKIPYEVDYYSPYSGFRWWSLMFPIPSAAGEAIYVVYAGALEPAGMPKVFIVKSMDGGVTWSRPKLVSPEGGAQFFPWITVGRDGAVHVIWGDTRNDPSNFGYDIYYSVSRDGGETFSTPERVTDYTSNPIFGIWGFIGDYFNAVATGKNVHIVWTDTRRGLARIGGFTWIGVDQSIFTAKLGPRPRLRIEIEPSTMEAGQTGVIIIRGLNLPREAPLVVGFEGVTMGSLAFTDSEGRVEIRVLAPVTREGDVKITLHDFTTLNIIAEGSLKVVNTALATMKASTEKLSSQLNESVKTLSDTLAIFKREVVGRVETVTSMVNEVKEGLGKFREDFETTAKTIGVTLGGVQSTVKNVEATVNTINSAIPDLAKRSDVETAKGSLEEAIGEARDVVAASSRNWGAVNAFLIVVALVILAYHAYTTRKS